jgi:lipopolysaccharide export system ATP-binding protein
MARLGVDQISKTIRSRRVVNRVSLYLDSGEVIGLLGPNGAGKTTCFYMIVGLIPADSGSVRLESHAITDLPMHARARLGVGYLPQEASVFRKLSVANNLLAVLESDRRLDAEQRRRRSQDLLDEFGIAHLADNFAYTLSGGERRRLEIARALAMQPRFILLDEPFAGVDPIAINDIKQVVSHLRDKGIGVLITDHNVRETLDICQRAYIINQGSLLAEGTPRQLLDDARVRQSYLGEHFRL